MSDKETSGEPVTSADILFECGSCGKSLVIDANGAGLAVTGPDCGAPSTGGPSLRNAGCTLPSGKPQK